MGIQQGVETHPAIKVQHLERAVKAVWMMGLEALGLVLAVDRIGGALGAGFLP
jgi:hypothetical protein